MKITHNLFTLEEIIKILYLHKTSSLSGNQIAQKLSLEKRAVYYCIWSINRYYWDIPLENRSKKRQRNVYSKAIPIVKEYIAKGIDPTKESLPSVEHPRESQASSGEAIVHEPETPIASTEKEEDPFVEFQKEFMYSLGKLIGKGSQQLLDSAVKKVNEKNLELQEVINRLKVENEALKVENDKLKNNTVAEFLRKRFN